MADEVFILGAGFSKAVNPTMPSLWELGDALRRIAPLPIEQTGTIAFVKDTELWLTYLSQDHPWLSASTNLRNKAYFIDLSHAIEKVITESTIRALAEVLPDWLANLITYWDRNRSKVITLNYDFLVEWALAQSRGTLAVVDGLYPRSIVRKSDKVFIGDPGQPDERSFTLLKLHGSVNWYYSGLETFPGESVYYVHPDQDLSRYRQELDEEVLSMAPFIVPPVADKIARFSNNAIRSIWSLAADALNKAQRIYCLGYSLPETDLTMRFLLAGSEDKTNRPTFVVVNKDETMTQRVRRVLGEQFSFEFPGLGSEDCIAQLVEQLRPMAQIEEEKRQREEADRRRVEMESFMRSASMPHRRPYRTAPGVPIVPPKPEGQ